MTGPEHYQEAERIIGEAPAPALTAGALALAQVHTGLALAAATALHEPAEGLPGRDRAGWYRAAGTQPQKDVPL